METVLSRLDRGLHDVLHGESHYNAVTTTYTMKVTDRVLHVTPGSGAYTVTLPSVVEAAGQFYAVKGIGSGTANVTVEDADDAVGTVSVVLDAAGEMALFFSDGESWWVIATVNVS